MNTPISLAALLERFFTQRLMQQRQASPTAGGKEPDRSSRPLPDYG
jgi:hypothetical protein